MGVTTPVTAEFSGAVRLSPPGPLDGAMYEIRFRWVITPKPVRPGQFFMVRPSEGSQPLLGRPLSPLAVSSKEIVFGIRVHGEGTRRMAKALSGEPWSVSGPYGNGFDSPVTPQERIWLVGGGVGVPPLVHLASTSPAQYTALIGARSASDLNWTDTFGSAGVFVSTDDGSEGFRGTAAGLLEKLLGNSRKPDRVICCGPHPMMAAVSKICTTRNIRCDVSLEERMACGTGICISCVCPIRTPDGNYRRARACVEGPVFNAEEVAW